MRRFNWLALVLFIAACGGDPSEHRDTCHPDPREARAAVSVAVRSDAFAAVEASDISIERALHLWSLRYESESGATGLSSIPLPGNESRGATPPFDAIRGELVTFTLVPDSLLEAVANAEPVFYTIALDRSCELVIVVSDEWDGANLTFHLSHFWR